MRAVQSQREFEEAEAADTSESEEAHKSAEIVQAMNEL